MGLQPIPHGAPSRTWKHSRGLQGCSAGPKQRLNCAGAQRAAVCKRECTSGCRRPALPLQDIGPAGEVWPCCEDHREAARRARPAAHGRSSDAVDLARAAARLAVHRVLAHTLVVHGWWWRNRRGEAACSCVVACECVAVCTPPRAPQSTGGLGAGGAVPAESSLQWQSSPEASRWPPPTHP
eukprot:scaffold224_cov71-Phaeocystis_antarctica.AAC.3